MQCNMIYDSQGLGKKWMFGRSYGGSDEMIHSRKRTAAPYHCVCLSVMIQGQVVYLPFVHVQTARVHWNICAKLLESELRKITEKRTNK